jgi:hypothetical protein
LSSLPGRFPGDGLTLGDMVLLRTFPAKRPDASPDEGVFPSDRIDGPQQYASIATRRIRPKAKSFGLLHITRGLFRYCLATVLGDASVPVKDARGEWGISGRKSQ